MCQLLGSLTRQRVREGSAVRDAPPGAGARSPADAKAWQSPLEQRRRGKSRGGGGGGAGGGRAGGLALGLPGERKLECGGEALGVASRILSLRSQLASARDEQLEAELLEEAEHGFAVSTSACRRLPSLDCVADADGSRCVCRRCRGCKGWAGRGRRAGRA